MVQTRLNKLGAILDNTRVYNYYSTIIDLAPDIVDAKHDISQKEIAKLLHLTEPKLSALFPVLEQLAERQSYVDVEVSTPMGVYTLPVIPVDMNVVDNIDSALNG